MTRSINLGQACTAMLLAGAASVLTLSGALLAIVS